jgi:hypothetical protein
MSPTKRKTLASTLVLSIGLPLGATARAAEAPACYRLCLLKVMDRFLASMAAGRRGYLPLTPDAEVRENTRPVPLDETTRKRARSVRSVMSFADPVTGNVVSRAGVELDGGKAGYTPPGSRWPAAGASATSR